MAHPTIRGDEARDLFARQLGEFRAEGPAPDSGARLAATCAGSEEGRRNLEARQAAHEGRAAMSPRR